MLVLKILKDAQDIYISISGIKNMLFRAWIAQPMMMALSNNGVA